MLVIVEGVDGVGKTLFCEQLVESIKQHRPGDTVHLYHQGPPEHDDMLEEYELPLQWYRPGRRAHVVCDRWHVGELIYGPLLRGRNKLDLSRRNHVEMFLASRGALVVHLTADLKEVHRRRHIRDGDDLLDNHQVLEVMSKYAAVLPTSLCKVIDVDWPRWSAGQKATVIRVLELAKRSEVSAKWCRAFPTYVGQTRYGGIVLLGEKRNQNHDQRWESAFVPVNGSSGQYLLSSLLPYNVLVGCGVANALEEDVVSLASITGASFVALGREAHQVLEDAKIPHGSVPHPQFIRRFHHHRRLEYGHAIERAAFLQEDLLTWRP